MPEGSVGIGGGDVAGGAVEFADVLGEIPTVCMPSAADLDDQRTGGDGLGGVPCEQPQAGVMTTGEIHASNLQVAAVEITMVECHAAVGCYLLVGAASHGIIGAFHHRAAVSVREAHRAILRIVHSAPDAGLSLDERLVSIGIVLRHEGGDTILRDGGVLVERAGIVQGNIVSFSGLLPVANVVVGVFVVCVLYLCFHQLIWQQLCAICTLSSITTSAKLPTWSW